MLNYVATAIFLAGVGGVAAIQILAFIRDVAFYHKAGWDLSRDSGNNLLFLEPMKESDLFKRIPVGLLRLVVGAFFISLGGALLYAILFAIYGPR